MKPWTALFLEEKNMKLEKHRKGKKESYYVCDNIFCFDIETSSYFIDDLGSVYTYKDIAEGALFARIKDKREKYNAIQEYLSKFKKGACCYIWQFSFDEKRYYGRTLEEFKQFFDMLCDCIEMPFVTSVHNLSYEYQFLRGVFGDNNIDGFYTEARKPLTFRYKNSEWRCTYRLTNSSLAQWGHKIGIEKLDTLDYLELYTPKSELPHDALEYAERDIEIMYKGLQEYVKEYGNIWNIPLTQTGRPRRDIKKLYHNDINHHFRITDTVPADHNEYKTLRCCYMGGIVFTGVENAGKIIKKPGSYDRASAYPFEMVARPYPSSKFRPCYTNTFDFELYHYIFYARFSNCKAKTSICCIPSSKMWNKHGSGRYNNGKLLEYDGTFEMFLTEIDLQTYEQFYDFDISYKKVWVATSSLLDIKFVEYVLKLYGDKTILKGIEGREAEYMRGKETLNSCYGMSCTSLVFDDTILDGDGIFLTLVKDDAEVDQELAKLKKNIWKNNLSYSMGIYVTAYQRADLLKMVSQISPSDMCYSDTDSIKVKHPEKYAALFDKENESITSDLMQLADHRGIDFEKFRPEDQKGKKHLIGIWENEGIYERAIFLGAKRYAYEQKDKDGNIKQHIVVAGVPKAAEKNISFEEFKDGLVFTPEDCGYKKNILVYLDGNNPEVVLKRGAPDEWKVTDKYAISMYPAGYDMSLTKEYKNLIDLYNNRKGNTII